MLKLITIEVNAKKNLKDDYGAISDYTKAIGLDPDYAAAYNNRGVAKELIGDLNGACSDWKKAANLGHTNAAKWVANQCN
jgi:tetratricopeptide (TPR) repeat protein